MTAAIRQIISEQNSPLFRIMWVTNPANQQFRQFDNNISAFHIGDGLVLSVAHNLRSESTLMKSVPADIFTNEILPQLNSSQQELFKLSYNLEGNSGFYNIGTTNAGYIKAVTDIYRQINFDKRWVTLEEKNISTPHLIIQFKENRFYQNDSLTSLFNSNHYFFEPSLNRHTFLLPLKLELASFENDIAIYSMFETPKVIIDAVPFVEPDFSLIENENALLYCLQSSPAGNLGRLLNKAFIEGYLDQYQVFNDRIGGNYVLEGLRYLIKGYFRFGSSGAPYLVYDDVKQKLKVNAIQSEASPIQLSINHNREGNYQYVNAIASPLNNVASQLKDLIGQRKAKS